MENKTFLAYFGSFLPIVNFFPFHLHGGTTCMHKQHISTVRVDSTHATLDNAEH